MKTENALKNEICNKLESGKSLRKLAKEYCVSHGVIDRISKGIFPKQNEIRKRLNLSLIGEAEICEFCGVVHLRKCKGSFVHRLSQSDISNQDKIGISFIFSILNKQ